MDYSSTVIVAHNIFSLFNEIKMIKSLKNKDNYSLYYVINFNTASVFIHSFIGLT